MSSNQSGPAPADIMALLLSPLLIMALIGSLVFFLLEILYAGAHPGRMQWILFFFVFGAIACLWVATTRQSIALAWTAAAAVSCAALTKGQTAYVFYALAALVLLRRHAMRRFLLRPGVLAPQLVAAALYFVWHQHLTGGAQQDTDLRVIVEKLRAFDPPAYMRQVLWFPLETAL